MERHILLVLIISALILPGCGKTEPLSGKIKGPESVYMARHITAAHGVSIGREETADIQVSQSEEGMIHVRFNPRFYAALPQGAFFILRIDREETELTKEEYISFLGMLHAYLMMSPPRKAEEDQ